MSPRCAEDSAPADLLTPDAPCGRISILDSHLEGVVLDNRYYAGSCLPHYIQDVRFRKPYNLQQYTLQVSLAARKPSA